MYFGGINKWVEDELHFLQKVDKTPNQRQVFTTRQGEEHLQLNRAV